MAKPRVFEKPLGMRDLLPETVLYKRQLETKIQHCLRRWGYEEIVTPTLEYYDTIGEASLIEENKLFKLLDRSGHTLVLRPDMTAPIARVISSILRDEPLPLRLSYHCNVFRAQEQEAGRHAEFFQSGVELVGEGSAEADAEVVALAVDCLLEAGVKDFRIALGSMSYVDVLLSEVVGNKEEESLLKHYLLHRDYVSFREHVISSSLSKEQSRSLLELLQYRGSVQKLEIALEMATSIETRSSLNHIMNMWEALEEYGVTEWIQIDLSLVSTIHYYTGMIFEGYASNIGFPICSGGRYDQLLEQFGRKSPATGFALKMDRVMEASQAKREAKERKTLIQYEPTYRKEALALAKKMRNETDDAVVTERVDRLRERMHQNKDNKWKEVLWLGEEGFCD